jgi:hypothetical protein
MLFLSNMISPLLKNGHAYLDPGSGSFILQLLIAAILGGGFALKIYWKKLVAFFKKNKGTEDQITPEEKKE